jgi:lipopolysaccharide biosynthesis protein
VIDDNQEPDDLIEALRIENDELRMRMAQLEAATEEYRRQMTEVLTSASWRATAPVRGVAGKFRLARRRSKEWPRRLRDRPVAVVTPTTGLFPPKAAFGIAADSPLLTGPRPSAVARTTPRIEPTGSGAKVLVVAHVFYPEVWPDIEDRLSRMPEQFDLVVTLVRGRAESLEPELMRRFPRARIHHVDNYGRDQGPLIELANMGLFEGYDAVLKVHTKRSRHRLDGDAWRVALLDALLPSPEGIRRMIELLRKDPNVGLVAPSGHVRGPETWGSDRELVESLASRMPFAFDPDALQYPAGSMYWARPWLLARLGDLQLTREHFEIEADHLDGSTAHALERYIGVSATVAGLDLVEADDVPSRLHRARRLPETKPRVLAFYLPQYHRSVDNDRFWGDGFTDWVNVDKARPLYEGHHQPLVPSGLGRYDLTDLDVMRKQAALAQNHGLSGFLMYHYWFNGRRVLDRPLRNLLADPSVDFPFALCWANESWTRSWDGLEKDLLIEQTYTGDWADRYYDEVLPALRDRRYLRVDEKPLLVVYRAGHLPDGAAVVDRWKERAADDDLGGLHVLGLVPSRDFEGLPTDTLSALDGLIRFPPSSGIGLQSLRPLLRGSAEPLRGEIYSYDAAVDGADLTTSGPGGLRIHPGVMPGWDNTARRATAAYIFHGSNPLSFRRWLSRACSAAQAAGREPLVFVNAWTEWAEGATLEPDARFGLSFAEATADHMVAR